jgi:hypothetical protein
MKQYKSKLRTHPSTNSHQKSTQSQLELQTIQNSNFKDTNNPYGPAQQQRITLKTQTYHQTSYPCPISQD